MTGLDALTVLLPRVGPWYALTLVLVLAYWLWRVVRAAQARRVPRVAWWALAGWLALLYAPILEQPTLFGIGAALLLLAEYWPYAYRVAPARPATPWAIWSAGALVLGIVLLSAALNTALTTGTAEHLAFAAGLGAWVAGLVGLATFWGWPRAASARASAPHSVTGVMAGADWRFARTTVPEWPELSLSLGTNGAELHNISAQPLELAGWSPTRVNGWLPLRDQSGQPLRLNTGESAYLPLEPYDSGLRVWYRHAQQPELYLFRANWQPRRPQEQRVLN